MCHTYYDTSHLFLWRPVTFDITVKWLKVLVERQWLTSVNHLINQTSCEKFGCFNVLVLPWPGFSMKKLWQSTPRWQRALSKGYTCTMDLLFDSWAVRWVYKQITIFSSLIQRNQESRYYRDMQLLIRHVSSEKKNLTTLEKYFKVHVNQKKVLLIVILTFSSV